MSNAGGLFKTIKKFTAGKIAMRLSVCQVVLKVSVRAFLSELLTIWEEKHEVKSCITGTRPPDVSISGPCWSGSVFYKGVQAPGAWFCYIMLI